MSIVSTPLDSNPIWGELHYRLTFFNPHPVTHVYHVYIEFYDDMGLYDVGYFDFNSTGLVPSVVQINEVINYHAKHLKFPPEVKRIDVI